MIIRIPDFYFRRGCSHDFYRLFAEIRAYFREGFG
jgi:hypothetical protein